MRVLITRQLPKLPEPWRSEWRRWLAMYDLDPLRIPLDSTIVCDDERRTVSATYVPSPDRPGEFKRVTRQLESIPAPFPPGEEVC